MLLEGYEVLIPIKHEYSIGEGKILAVCTLPSMDLYQTIARTADVVNRILIVGRLLSENKGMEFYLIQDTTILGHGGGLRKCWEGYKIAKSEGDRKKMEYYAKSIRKFPAGTETFVSEFLQFGPLGRNYCSYKQGS
jgi:hypothetical protein